MDKYFYRVNNLLIFTIVLFAGFLIFSESNLAHSVDQTQFDKYFPKKEGALVQSQLERNGNKVVGKNPKVNIKAGSFNVSYVSDGRNGKADPDTRDAFFKRLENGSITAVPVPLNFTVTKSFAELPGELVYGAIAKPTAPEGTFCDVKNANSTDVKLRNASNCLYYVTASSVYAEAAKDKVLISDPKQLTVKSGGNVFESIAAAIQSAAQQVVTNFGQPQNRDAVGSISYWAEDEIQQIAKINNKYIESTEISVESTAVNRDEAYFLVNLSSQIDSNVLLTAIKSNVGDDVGMGNITSLESYRKTVTDPNQPQPVENILSQLIPKIFGGNADETTKQRKLSPHVALRPYAISDTFGVAYSFCDAARQLKGYGNWGFPNEFAGKRLSDDSYSYEDVYEGRANFSISSSSKACLSAVEDYQTRDKALECLEYMITHGGSGCQEFSIEENYLQFSMIESTIPIGLGAYFQNATINNISPNTEGPFYNYLSPYFCARFDVTYKISANQSYVYRYGGEGTSGAKDNTNFNNQYCIVGSLLSNFSWVLSQQQNNFGLDNIGSSINIPKEALTCEKKENVIFGATIAKSNVQAPDSQLIYINDDNSRGLIDSEDVLVNHGYNPYSLNNILKENGNVPIFKYRDNDIKIIVGTSNKPEYAMYVTNPTNGSKQVMLCRLKQNVGTYKDSSGKVVNEKLCAMIEDLGPREVIEDGKKEAQNAFLLTGEATLTHQGDYDFITIVSYDFETMQKDKPPLVKYYTVAFNTKAAITSGKDMRRDVTANPRILDKKADGGKLTFGVYYGKFELKAYGKENVVGALMTRWEKGKIDTGFEFYLLDLNKIDLEKGIGPEVTFKTQPFCTSVNKVYCDYIQQNWASSKLIHDNISGQTFAVLMSQGFGLIFNLSGVETLSNKESLLPTQAGFFTYVAKSGSFAGDMDFIADAKYHNGEFHIFMERSGYYLKVVPITNLQDANLRNSILSKCPINTTGVSSDLGAKECYIAVQYEFNPSNFVGDFSDYYGKGHAPYPALKELGQPRVLYFDFAINGKMFAWYVYPGLQKTIMYSQDMLYAYSGVYSRVSGDTFSNAYVPRLDTKKAPYLFTTPISYFNYGSGGLKINQHLRFKNGESAGSGPENIIEITEVMRPDKYKCFLNMSRVTGTDLLFNSTGLQPVDLTEVKMLPGTSEGVNGPLAPYNPNLHGDYCEEKWCTAGNINLYQNPEYNNQGNDTALKLKIAQYVAKTTRTASFKGTVIDPNKYSNPGNICNGAYAVSLNNKADQIYCRVDFTCKEADKQGIPCAFLIGLWSQESTMEMFDTNEKDPNFGCFIKEIYQDALKEAQEKNHLSDIKLYTDLLARWYRFDVQVRCAMGSIKSSQEKFLKGERLSGPGSVFTPNVGLKAAGQKFTGECKPHTMFSMIMQRYTPSDKRINFNNQCNRGVVVRNDQEVFGRQCDFTYHRPKGAEASSSAFNADTTGVEWPHGELLNSRVSLRATLDALGLPTTENCFPSPNFDPTSNSTEGTVAPDQVLAKRNLEASSTVGNFKMNIGNWDTPRATGSLNGGAAGSVRVIMDGINGHKPLLGLHEIKPGQTFSFNETIGNMDYKEVMDNVYGLNGKTPAKSATMNVLYKDRYDFNDGKCKVGGEITIGCGWCEVATTIRFAAGKIQGIGGTESPLKDGDKYFNSGPVKSPKGESYGTGAAYTGDVKHWKHSARITSFPEVPGYQFNDERQFVAIVTKPHLKEDDGDLLVTNSTKDETLFIQISYQTTIESNPNNIINVNVFYGKPKGSPTPSPVTEEKKMDTVANTPAVVNERKRIV